MGQEGVGQEGVGQKAEVRSYRALGALLTTLDLTLVKYIINHWMF